MGMHYNQYMSSSVRQSIPMIRHLLATLNFRKFSVRPSARRSQFVKITLVPRDILYHFLHTNGCQHLLTTGMCNNLFALYCMTLGFVLSSLCESCRALGSALYSCTTLMIYTLEKFTYIPFTCTHQIKIA